MNATFDTDAARASIRRLSSGHREQLQRAYERILATDADPRRQQHATRILALLEDVKREVSRA